MFRDMLFVLLMSCVATSSYATEKEPKNGGGGTKNTQKKALATRTTFILDGKVYEASKYYDPDGKIVDYEWTCLSGPKRYSLKNTNMPIASVSHLIAGTYIFSLTATDDKGLKAAGKVTVVVSGTKK